MKYLIFLILHSSLSFARLPGESSFGSPYNLKAEGNLISVQFARGNPVRIYVVGKEEAKLDLSNLQLTVRRLSPYPAKILRVDRDNESFILSDDVDLNKNSEIEITAKVNNKTETFKFKLEGKLH